MQYFRKNSALVAIKCCVLLGLAFASNAMAAWQVAVSPSDPVIGQQIFVDVTSTTGPVCFPFAAVVSTVNSDVFVKLMAGDSCGAEDIASARSYPVGVLGEGTYSLHVEYCSDNPPPFPVDCSTIADIPLRVLGSSIVAVPTNSWYAVLALIILVALAATKALSWRRMKTMIGRGVR